MNLNLSLSQQNDRTLVSRDYNEGVRNDADEDNEHSDYESYTDGDDEAEISLGSSSSTDVEGEFNSNLHIQVTENVGEDTVIPFWNVTPKYKYINWEYPDQEMDEKHLQEVKSWVEGDPLFVGLYFDRMVNEEPSVHISLIQEQICAQFGYKISYKKAWKAKQKAIVKVFGDWDESYATLPRWLEYMQLNSPGFVYKLETKEYVVGHQVNNRYRVFERLFWSFEQCHEAFKFCKPILQVDGTFLYGKYRHTLLIATTQDGNNCVLPVAFAIIEGETLSAWEWFLALIRLHVTDRAGICLISDRHQSIKGAVSNPHIGWQPPNAYHVYCIRHIASNFNHRFKNIALKKELIKLDIERWIDSISKEKWALSYDDEGQRYGHMTTNLSESVNKVFKGARNLPICALVKATYGRLVEYFVKRGEEAMSDLHNGSMFCLACIAVSINFWQYVDPVYSMQYVVNAYSPQWKPLGNECNILTNCEWKLMPDVDRARGKGRPKSTRIRNEMDWVESQTRQRCSKCNEVGHNRCHCPQQNNVG
ncbi:uncharacterized protein LOC113850565 [Abrus precatorius]|uniref:Uncharacterized protein LOC113850565 n=1 Tax=Abrus precatorius TaxID=3816 RepID=A0A8B8JZQ7_ABRPR|nr:uncharacterized protein LOC113850565 [Abrus precatorius]